MLLLVTLLLAQANSPVRTLQVTGLPSAGSPVAVLLNATGPQCRDPLVLPIPESGTLPLPVGQLCWSCQDKHAGLAVASRDRGGAYKAVSDICQAAIISVQLDERKPVEVHVWPRTPDLAALARDDLFHTDWVLNESRVGLTLRPIFHEASENIAKLECDTALAHPGLVRGQINLFYGHDNANTSCAGQDRPESEVVLVNDQPVLGIAAHELGHKLGVNQSDHVGKYPNGHTTSKEGFNCANNLWQGAHGLNTRYSLGQAVWMRNSCSSFAGRSFGACLPCQRGRGKHSPCPPLRLEQNEDQAPCEACTLADVKEILGVKTKAAALALDPQLGAGLQKRFCTSRAIEETLGHRFDLLAKHPAVGELRLHSASRDEFIARWIPFMKAAIAIDAVTHTSSRAERKEGLQLLKGTLTSHYAEWAEEQLRQGKQPNDCLTGTKWKPLAKKTRQKP